MPPQRHQSQNHPNKNHRPNRPPVDLSNNQPLPQNSPIQPAQHKNVLPLLPP